MAGAADLGYHQGPGMGFPFICLQHDCWCSSNHLCIPNWKKERGKGQKGFSKPGKHAGAVSHGHSKLQGRQGNVFQLCTLLPLGKLGPYW